MRRAVTRVIRQVGCRRGCVTADRGCAAVALCTLLTASGVACVLRVKQSTKLALAGGQTLYPLRFPGTTRRRPLGQGLEWAGAPPPLWGTMRRQREWQGTWGHWYVGRQAALCSGASRGSSGLARCAMVAGLCPRPDRAAHRVGAAVGPRGPRAVRGGASGAQVGGAGGHTGASLAATRGLAPLWALCVAPGQCHEQFAPPDPRVAGPSCPSEQAQARQRFSKSVLTSGPRYNGSMSSPQVIPSSTAEVAPMCPAFAALYAAFHGAPAQTSAQYAEQTQPC